MVTPNIKQQINNIVEIKYTLQNADINRIGELLGHGWNDVCREVRKTGLHSEDSAGSITLHRYGWEGDGIHSSSEMLNEIIASIFDSVPSEVDEITVINT